MECIRAGIDEAEEAHFFEVYTAAVVLPQDETFIQPLCVIVKIICKKGDTNFVKKNCIDYAVTYKDHNEIDT